MAVVTSDFLQDLLTTNQALWETDFAAAQALQGWRSMALMRTSTSRYQRYDWLGTVPTMVDVTDGTIEFADLLPHDFLVRTGSTRAASKSSATRWRTTSWA